jgi:hypothetical protein
MHTRTSTSTSSRRNTFHYVPGARIGRKEPPVKKPTSDTEVERLRKLVEQLAAEVAEIKNSPK